MDTQPAIGNGFRGDASFVYALEGSGLDFYGRSCYWPGGASGVTLDPGFDLGYQSADALKETYEDVLAGAQMAACLASLGVRGRAAKSRIDASDALRSIVIEEDVAADLFPRVARPYWTSIARRFPDLTASSVPPSVQTVFLSLAYNRGPRNRALETLRAPLAGRDWPAVADAVAAMQDEHPVEGVTKRRDQEAEHLEAQLEKRRRKERRLADALRTIPARDLDEHTPPSPLPSITDLPVAPPAGASSLTNPTRPMTAEEEAVQNVTSLDDAREVVNEWFDDPEDKEVVVEKLNAAIDVPGIPEELEGVVLSRVLEAIIYGAKHLNLA